MPMMYPNQSPMEWHNPTKGCPEIIKTFMKDCEKSGVQVFFKTSANEIVLDKAGKVSEVIAKAAKKEITIKTKGVIIATRGYGGNNRLIKKYNPKFNLDNVKLNMLKKMHDGDGLRMAFEIGADDDGLRILLMNGPNFIAGNHAWMLAMNAGAIRVNSNGERFAAENLGPFVSDNTTLRQPGQVMFSVFDDSFKQHVIKNGFGPISSGKYRHEASGIEQDLKVAIARGSCYAADSWEEIANWIGAPPENLEATIKEHNSFCKKGHDDLFTKDAMFLKAIKTPPYYACRCYPGFLVTISGIKINERMEVLKPDFTPIPGLYAVGITTGGWSGSTYNIGLPGTGCGFAVYGGRIAGENAVDSL